MSGDIEIAREAIAFVREHYDESIFPPRPKGRHTEVYDGEAAAVARLTCDNILAEFNKRLGEKELFDGAAMQAEWGGR